MFIIRPLPSHIKDAIHEQPKEIIKKKFSRKAKARRGEKN